MAANQSAGHTAQFVNVGRNVVVASKSGRVETDQPDWWLLPWLSDKGMACPKKEQIVVFFRLSYTLVSLKLNAS